MRNRSAFTLVELLVVVGIIALLIALLLPTLAGARKSARSVECAAQLREMFAAQNFFADDNRGRYVIGTVAGEGRWEAQLERYVAQRTGERGRIYHCPTLPPERATQADSSYGVNPCTRMPFWNGRRHRKMDAARIVFMGDKAATLDDFLTTDDGYYFSNPDPAAAPVWIRSTGHSGRSSYRHGKERVANFVMADGHVESLGADQLARRSGAWYPGSAEHYRTVQIISVNCCP